MFNKGHVQVLVAGNSHFWLCLPSTNAQSEEWIKYPTKPTYTTLKTSVMISYHQITMYYALHYL